MSNNEFMYAVERSDEYLAHYGIRGMKWGVRRAIKSGNSNRLDKQYKKAQKKLAKLEKQASNSKKYARRAALMGAGAAAAGGLAAAGTGGVSKAMHVVGAYGSRAMRGVGTGIERAGTGIHKGLAAVGQGALGNKIHKGMNTVGRGMNRAAAPMGVGVANAAEAVSKWGHSKSIANKLADAGRSGSFNTAQALRKATGGSRAIADANFKTIQATNKLRGVSNNTIARIGAGAIGAGLAVGAARNAYKAATAQKRAAKFRSAMNESFKGTKYANGGQPRQGKKRRRK